MRTPLTKNFYRDEFECPCCQLFKTEREVIEKLQKIRDEVGQALKVSSGTRCLAHNEAVGGAMLSDHVRGLAVDIACNNGQFRRRIVEAGLKHFPTIGVKKDCVHLSVGKPSRIFTYD